jgi:Mor family transcriptional regulator
MIAAIIILILLIVCPILRSGYHHKKIYLYDNVQYEVSFRAAGKSHWLESKVKRIFDEKVYKDCDHGKKKYFETIDNYHLTRVAAGEVIAAFLHNEAMHAFFNNKNVENLTNV